MLVATDWSAVDSGLPQNPICDAVGISGLYDLEPIRHCFLNQTLGLSPDSAVRNSPAALVRACTSPMLLAVGGDEGAEYLRQSRTLGKAWAEGMNPPQIQVLEGAHHFSIMSQLEDRDAPLSQIMQARIGCR
jgi:arylformamidase